MRVFLDFEASSLGKDGYPIEVAWAFEDGRSESHLIRPAPAWADWSAEAEAIHRIPLAQLEAEGEPHEAVAARMVTELTGHALFASAPSWDGKWLSTLLRAAGHPRHALRLSGTMLAQQQIAAEILAPVVPPRELSRRIDEIVALAAAGRASTPAHRALADAEEERRIWLATRSLAERLRAMLAEQRQG